MKLWGGRFEQSPSEIMEEFNSSLPFDKRLFKEDIAVNIAHAKMLGKAGIITEEEAKTLEKGLKAVLKDMEAGKFVYQASDEDIHTAVERGLTERVGATGGKLRTSRSRNDQVVTDFRLFVKNETAATVDLLIELIETIASRAEKDGAALMPGYTHMQKAQPVSLGQHLMAYAFMFSRDAERFLDSMKRTDVLVLGSGALAGTTYQIDQAAVAADLGFAKISENSMDAVSDRDFALEFLAASAITMVHLSRLAEELVVWSSREFGFASLAEEFSTGSSIMPQKKNPDAAELLRGKAGRVFGDLMTLLTVMKGLPLAYNKDMQEDKEAVFDAADTMEKSLRVCSGVMETVAFDAGRMSKAANDDFITATELADYLAVKGMPFGQAHTIVGTIVKTCLRKGKTLADVSVEEYKDYSPLFGRDVIDVIPVRRSVERRVSRGGTAPEQVKMQIKAVREAAERYRAGLK
jgi:argininosuccinate lyase